MANTGSLITGRDVAKLHLTANERRVLDWIRRSGGGTRADLTRSMDLTAQSISRIVDALLEHDLIRIGENIVKGRGQPSSRLHIQHSAVYSVGLSVMTDAISGVVMDLGGNLIANELLHIKQFGADDVISSIRDLYLRLLAVTDLNPHQVMGAGIGVTGFFTGMGKQLNPPDPLGELGLVDLVLVLGEVLDRPVWVDNDGNMAATAEALCGAGYQYPTFAYLYFSLGLGGGLIIDGKLFPGAFGNAGEFAGILPPEQQDQRPTLELLRRMMGDRGQHYSDIYQMLRQFDMQAPGVEEWITSAQSVLSTICSAIAAVLDPHAIIFGGRLPLELGRTLASGVTIQAVPRRGITKPAPIITTSSVKGDATAIGAAATPLKACLLV